MNRHLIISLFFVLYACTTKQNIPLENRVTVIELQESKLKEGKNIYESKCSCCHRLYPPNKFTHLEWNYNLNKMQIEAEITDEERALVYQYLRSESNPD